MSKIYNYCAFYVAEPFNPSSLGAHATKDFCHYNMLRAWKGADNTFPFNNAHDTTYNVRDNSDWELTLKPRLRSRLKNSSNIVLYLSDYTRYSRALKEEIDYGVNVLGLPIIVIYPNFKTKVELLTVMRNGLNSRVKSLWGNLPVFQNSKFKVPVLHIPMNKEIIKNALNNSSFRAGSVKPCMDYYYS